MSQLSLTAIDFVAIAVIFVSAAYAMFRGLVHETLAIFGWLAAGYAALRLTPLLQPFIRGHISPPWLEWIAVAAGTFLLVFIPLSFASRRIAEAVKKSRVGAADRVLGLIFGVGRGLVIVSLAYIAFAALVPARDHPEMLTKARLFPAIRDTSDVLRSFMPLAQKGDDERGTRSPDSRRTVLTTSPSRWETTKPYGAAVHGALDRLFQTNAASGNSSR